MACPLCYVISFKSFHVANIVAIGHKVSFVLPFGARGFVYVHVHIFHVCFGFFPPSMVVEE